VRIIVILSVVLLTFAASVRAEETAVPYTLADRERMIRVEQRLDDLDKRMDGLDKRMDGLEGRMDRLEMSIDSKFQTLYIVFFTGIVGLVGFVLWDRRTMVKPVAEDQRSLSEREAKLEHILREYAKGEPRLAEILKQYALW
jgi:hypothetical protein